MNLYEKLIEVRKCVPYLKKDTQGYQYVYVSGSSVLGAIKAKMDELGVLLFPEVDKYEMTEYSSVNKQGKTVIDQVLKSTGFMVWKNAETPEEEIKIPWVFVGQDADISKSFGKALTYSERYFLLKFFNIATDSDDPDAFQQKNNPSQPPPPPPKSKKDIPPAERLLNMKLKGYGDLLREAYIACGEDELATDESLPIVKGAKKQREVLEAALEIMKKNAGAADFPTQETPGA